MSFLKNTGILLLILMMACKEEDPTPLETRSNLELLTNNSSKVWVLKSGTATEGNASLNLVSTQNPCVTDNEIVLFKNFVYEFTEGATKCEEGDPQVIVRANWVLSEDEKTMTIDRLVFLGRAVDNPSFEITAISETEFSGISEDVLISGRLFNLEVVFERKE